MFTSEPVNHVTRVWYGKCTVKFCTVAAYDKLRTIFNNLGNKTKTHHIFRVSMFNRFRTYNLCILWFRTFYIFLKSNYGTLVLGLKDPNTEMSSSRPCVLPDLWVFIFSILFSKRKVYHTTDCTTYNIIRICLYDTIWYILDLNTISDGFNHRAALSTKRIATF